MSSEVFVRHYDLEIEIVDPGAVIPASVWTPGGTAGQPRQSGRVAGRAGRLPFSSIARPGVLSAFAQVRNVAGSGVQSMQVRSARNDEIVNLVGQQPWTVGEDKLLSSHQLTGRFAVPIQLGTTDALAFVPTDPDAPAAIEFLVIEFSSSTALEAFKAVVSATAAQEGAQEPALVVSFSNGESVFQLPAFEGVLYALGTTTSPFAVARLAPAAQVNRGRVVAARIGGSAFALLPAIGEAQNGIVNGRVEVTGFEAVESVRAGAGWLTAGKVATGAALVVNAVSGGSQNFAAPQYSDHGAQIDYTASGSLAVAPLSEWPRDSRAIVWRNIAETQVQVVLQDPTDRINGVTNGTAYLGPGEAAVFFRAPGSLVVLGSGAVDAGRFTNVAAGNVVLEPWGLRSKVVRLAGAAAQNAELPPRSLVPTGAAVRIFNSDAATAKSIAAVGGDLLVGRGLAPAASFVLPVRTAFDVVAGAANEWIVV